MEKKLYIVTDLGPGDGGKGGVVHKVSHLKGAHTILKVGGAQGSHGVATSAGDRFPFSQFGCGTFEGVRTHLTPRFVATPEGILNEGDALRNGCGIHDVFDLLTVDEGVLCATPFHGFASRLKELGRKNDPRGTIGTGVGEAYRDSQWYPELAIRARDLTSPHLRDKLAAARDRVKQNLELTIGAGFLPEDRGTAEREIALLGNPGLLDHVLQRFQEVARRVRIVDSGYLQREILARDGVVVVESSHGVLTDHYQGFHPHTSAIRTLPRFARDMIRGAGYDGEIVSIGVHRAYTIKHGAGPAPTTEEVKEGDLLPGSHKDENRYQGKARVGALDLVLLRYAIAASGGPAAYDGLAITWFDEPERSGVWWFCNRYANSSDPNFFTPSGELKVRFGEDAQQLRHQEELGRMLKGAIPTFDRRYIEPGTSQEELYDLCAGILNERLGVPVRMVSFGRTEREKLCR